MLRFTQGLAAGLCTAALLWLLLWAGQLSRPHPDNAWVAASIAYKQKLAKEAGSPKTLILAGSGAMFGIDSRMLKDTYGRPAVNLAVNAGITLPAILQTANGAVGPGDLVVLPLEYPLYNSATGVSVPEVNWLNSHPTLFRKLPLRRTFEVIMKTSLSRILEGYRGLPNNFVVSGDYGPQRLDERGDQTDTARDLRQPHHQKQLMAEPAARYGDQLARGKLDIHRLRQFRDEMLALGACPVFLPPPMRYRPTYREDPVEAAFYTRLPAMLREQGLWWVGQPFAAMRKSDDFFDTGFHLVAEARRNYTSQVINWLGHTPLSQCRAFYKSMAAAPAGIH